MVAHALNAQKTSARKRKDSQQKQTPLSRTDESENLILGKDLRDKEILREVNKSRASDKEGELAMQWVLGLRETFAICRRVVDDPHGWWTCYDSDVDDLHQEVLLRLYRYLPLQEEFDTAGNFFAWVKTIARNQYFSGIRKNKLSHEERLDLDADNALAGRELVSEQASPLAHVMGAELFEKLLGCLTTKDRDILIAWRCDKLTLEELGRKFALGTHREEVRRRVTRILNKVLENHAALAGKI